MKLLNVCSLLYPPAQNSGWPKRHSESEREGRGRGKPAGQCRLQAHLFANGSRHGDWEGPDIPSAQVLALPLVAEELQLPLLLLIQGVAVSDLQGHRGGREESLFTLIPLGFQSSGLSFLSKCAPVWVLGAWPGLEHGQAWGHLK